MLHLVEAQI